MRTKIRDAPARGGAAARLLFEIYKSEGHSEDQSFTLALVTMVATGTIVEIGDGVTVYGFSAQDLIADSTGTLAGLRINRYHLQDLLGIRLGKVPTTIPPDSEPSLGSDYSNEIYTGDLKLGGLVTRLHGNPGIARYFLTSFVYITKGFGYEPPLSTRYHEVGFELGLDFSAILMAMGVKETIWWGRGLIAFFNFFRIPFAQIGVYYNLTNHKWYGPGAPYHFY